MGVMALIQLGCRSTTTSQKFGLKRLDLQINPEDLGVLNSQLFLKTAVPGRLTAQDQLFEISVSYAGKSTLTHQKRNFQLTFKEPTHLTPAKPIELRLASQSSDPSGLRSLVGFHIFREHGLMTPFIEPVVLYLNGDFQGLYYTIDNVSEEWIEGQGGQVRSLYKAKFGRLGFGSLDPSTLLNLPEAFSVKSSHKSYTDLERFVIAVGEPTLGPLDAQLEVDTYLRYLSAAVFLNHWDGYQNNYFFYKDQLSGKFIIIPWDLDKIFPSDPPLFESKVMFEQNQVAIRLFEDDGLRQRYLDHLNVLLETYDEAAMTSLIEGYASRIREAYEHDRYFNPRGVGMEPAVERLKASYRYWHSSLAASL